LRNRLIAQTGEFNDGCCRIEAKLSRIFVGLHYSRFRLSVNINKGEKTHYLLSMPLSITRRGRESPGISGPCNAEKTLSVSKLNRIKLT
jgi:hypothetical protein